MNQVSSTVLIDGWGDLQPDADSHNVILDLGRKARGMLVRSLNKTNLSLDRRSDNRDATRVHGIRIDNCSKLEERIIVTGN